MTVSDTLQDFSQQRLASLRQAMHAAGLTDCDDNIFLQQLNFTLVASDFVFEQLLAHPQWIDLLQTDVIRAYEKPEFSYRLREHLKPCHSATELEYQLRCFRHYEIVRIIWRDVNQLAPLAEVMRDLSCIADACIRQAADLLQECLETELGHPCDKHGQPQKLQVIAMGKLGARELNLSSDIDLIYAYPEEGQVKGPRCLSNQEFFTRLAQQLTRSLHHVTAEGFVFRVDTRLRPYGESGALVMSFDALSAYYQNEAREWERYAMVKARIVYGDEQANRRLLTMLRRFTYRIYLDFSAMQSLRDLKDQIRRQVRAKDMENNIKLGAGGIREIEFIAQVFQLIHGGHDYALQTPHLIPVLEILARREYVEHVPKLIEAYIFLRVLEHRLQAIDNRQTHTLPDNQFIQQRIAYTLHFDNWQKLVEKLDGYRQFIKHEFEHVIEKRRAKAVKDSDQQLKQHTDDQKSVFENAVKEWDLRFQQQQLSEIAAERLARLLPLLKQAVWEDAEPVRALERVMRVVDSLLRHSAYLVFFEENPDALAVLIKLCAASPWITNQIARYPVLLAELLNERRLYLSADLNQLENLLAEQLSHVDHSNEEQVMDALRRFKRRQVLHVAASDVMDKLALMHVSDNLTDIAIVVLRWALKLAWEELTNKQGYPQRVDGSLCELDFIVIAYGKLGGIELGYGSDLDLVFVHDADELAMTQTKKNKRRKKNAVFESISGAQFYARLAKRLMDILSTQTTTGSLYSVDTRLRPGGNSGLIVASFAAFSEYQSHSAWTWEHQALVRARVVAGDIKLTEKFNQLRCEILARKRNNRKLARDIIEMREKMRKEAKLASKDHFSLKESKGAMTDIEFLAQYIVLAWSCKTPELLMYTDSIRIFETCESAALLSRKEVDLLCEAYRAFRQTRHRLTLQRLPDEVPEIEFIEQRRHVEHLWRKLLKQGLLRF